MAKVPVVYIQGGIFDDTLDETDKILRSSSGDLIYLVLKTDGGDPNAGYRILKLIQAKFDKIVVIIPAECMSTGTLMALGADIIYMRKSACLGPLDTRIRHPSDGSWISSIDVRDTASTIAGLVDSAAITFNETNRVNFSLGKETAGKLAFETASSLFQPIADKIDPYHLQASVRSATLGQEYAEDLLASRMMKTKPNLAKAVSKYLANEYSSHSYAITLDEASNRLALNAVDLAELSIWDEIKKGYNGNVRNRVELIEIAEKGPDAKSRQKKEGGDAAD